MPPAFINGFTSKGTSTSSFGSDMGTIVVPKSDPSIPATSKTKGANMTVEVGRKLMRGSWNAEPCVYSVALFKVKHLMSTFRWGPLFTEQVQGVSKGTDFYFNKSMSIVFFYFNKSIKPCSERSPIRNVGSWNANADLVAG